MTQQPPAAPTLHPKRCETCEHGKRLNLDSPRCNDAHVFACSKQNGKWMPSQEDGSPIAIVGCCSHSSTPDADARQRVEDVVKELEAMQSDAKKRSVHAHDIEDGKWCGCNLTDAPDAELKVLKKAIALLKDGVERK